MKHVLWILGLVLVISSCKKKESNPAEESPDGGNSNPPVTLTKYSLIVVKNGDGQGEVTSQPAGLSCGSICRMDSIIEGTTIALVGTPADGFEITGWTGNDIVVSTNSTSCNVFVNQTKTVTATFSRKKNSDTLLNWKYQAGCPVYYSSPAVDPAGNVYFGTGAHFAASGVRGVFSLDATGTLRWKYETGLSMYSPCVSDDGTIYVQDAMCKLYALSATGGLQWSLPLNAASEVGQVSPALGDDGTIYAGADALYAVTPGGAIKWRFDNNAGPVTIRSSPAIGTDNTVYVGVNGPLGVELWAVTSAGALRWKLALEGDFTFSSPALATDGTIYIGTEKGQGGIVHAISSSGTLKWKVAVNNTVRSSPCIGGDGTVYIGTKSMVSEAQLLAIAPDGNVRWRYTLEGIGSDIYCSPALAANGDIIFGAETQYLYFLKPDGTLRSRYNTNSGICWSSPLILQDGSVLIGNNNGDLFSVKSASGGLASTAWPKFRANNRNSGRR
jgi:outer membrane protein assembly factor BamB